MDTRVHPALAAALDEAEACSFVGRGAQLRQMAALLETRRDRAALLYVHGPAGVGKSALLRAFRRLAAARGTAVGLIDGHVAEPGRQGFWRSLAAGLGVPGGTGELGQTLLQRVVSADDLLLLVDGYDELLALDRWLRAEVFAALGPGVMAVLAGRRPPRQVWPGDAAWRALVEDMGLGDLAPDESEELLRRRGVEDPAARREAVALLGGRPLYLALGAQTLTGEGGGSAGGSGPTLSTSNREGDGTLAAGLLGLLLHPDSPGRTWSVGPEASGPERLLAAAAMVRSFDQAVLAAMAGPDTVATGWGRLMALPVVVPSGPR